MKIKLIALIGSLLTTSLFAATYTTDYLHMRANGTSSLPSITNRSDQNTGIFWPASDALGVATGGVEAARFTPTMATFVDDVTISGLAAGACYIDGSSVVRTESALAVSRGGTGLSSTPTNGQLLIGNGSGYALSTITGTTNRVTVTNGAGTITLSGPQDIATTSNVTFARTRFGDGSAATPSVSFTNSTGMGLYRVGANALGFATSGLLRSTLDADGRLGINATPVASAQLQIDSNERGFLPPRMTTAQKNAIGSAVAGLMVYDTDLSRINVYDGANWVDVGSGAWSTAGNAGTNPASNFVGTTDAQDLVFRTNSTEALRLNTSNQALAQNGSAASPSYSFTNSTGMGLYRVGDNSLGFTTNSTRAGNINSTGTWAIGPTDGVAANVLSVNRNITGSTTTAAINVNGAIQSDSTDNANIFRSSPSTQATTFTLNNLRHFAALPQTFGAGSTVTTQEGFSVGVAMTGATNNRGFVGSLASGTNVHNLYMSGTAQNYIAGNVGIGSGKTVPAQALDVNGNALFSGYINTASGTAAAPSYSFTSDPDSGLYRVNTNVLAISTDGTERIRFDATGNIAIGGTADSAVSLYQRRNPLSTSSIEFGIRNNVNLPAAGSLTDYRAFYSDLTSTSGSTATIRHFGAAQGTLNHTPSTQTGFDVNSSMTGGTANYGFRGQLSSNAARWNNYHDGTAQNYFRGNVGIGSGKTVPAVALDVAGVINTDTSLTLKESGAGTDKITIQAPTIAAPYTITLPVDDGNSGQALVTDGSGVLSWATPSGAGDVVGPASAVDSNLAAFDTGTGKLIKDSGIPLANVVQGPASAVSGNVATYNGATGKLIQDSGIVLSYGSYTPAASNLVNLVSVTGLSALYSQVGKRVTVFFDFGASRTTASGTETEFQLNLPIPKGSNFSTSDEAIGNVAGFRSTASLINESGIVVSEIGTQRVKLQWNSQGTASQTYRGSFMYTID